VVIELQHSNISIEEIRKREEFYGKMFWIVDAHPFAENLFFQKNTEKTVSEHGEIAWDRGES
jgi:competence CoiA-like predicted nuclease